MILNDADLSKEIPINRQPAEIERIQQISPGAMVFTSFTFENQDVIETLLHKSKIVWTKNVTGFIVIYKKSA